MQSRPFGVAFLVAGCDENGPVLYHTDPSGRYVSFEAWAIGAGSEGAQSLLQEKYSADMTLAEAEVLALSTLKQVRLVVYCVSMRDVCVPWQALFSYLDASLLTEQTRSASACSSILS
jgi:20S proteasome alpha/beta subunit